VIEKGSLVLRSDTSAAIDYYLSRGLSQEGKYYWKDDEIACAEHPFSPIGIRILNCKSEICDTVRSVEPFLLEIEYSLDEPVTGLRIGIYLMTTRGEYVFTSFDTDAPELFETFSVRPEGHYVSRCEIPANLLNEGNYSVGVNASSYRIRRYFQDDQALTFSVDAAGAAGMQWPEPRLGLIRPRLNWEIEEL
jgi:lipopolysaccharide transport system ATP-binding protein